VPNHEQHSHWPLEKPLERPTAKRSDCKFGQEASRFLHRDLAEKRTDSSDTADATAEHWARSVRQRFSAWRVRSILWSLFSRASAEISRPFYREFTPFVCWKPLLEPCSQACESFLLTIGGKCSPFRAKAAHISGHLPVVPPSRTTSFSRVRCVIRLVGKLCFFDNFRSHYVNVIT